VSITGEGEIEEGNKSHQKQQESVVEEKIEVALQVFCFVLENTASAESEKLEEQQQKEEEPVTDDDVIDEEKADTIINPEEVYQDQEGQSEQLEQQQQW
jgi:hypothetical protein